MEKIILNSYDFEQVKEYIKSIEYFDVIPVFSSYDNIHYLDRDLIGLFVASGSNRIIILNDHFRSEPFTIKISWISARYVSQSKSFYKFNYLLNTMDMEVSYWVDTNKELRFEPVLLNKFKRFYDKDAFKYVPESILFDVYNEYYEEFLRSDTERNQHYKITQTNILRKLSVIDRNGIQSKQGGINHPDYTFCNLTGRPNGSSMRYNYSALKKSSEGRSWAVSRHFKEGFLAEIDFSSYHMYLIADIIGYDKFGDQNVYEYFAKEYFGYDTLTQEIYENVKTKVFRALYSEEDDELYKYEFFQDLNSFKDYLYQTYLSQGYVETFKKSRVIGIPDLTRGKLFNYYLQSYETDNSMFVLGKLNDLLKERETKVILYTYDSFLFDFKRSEGKDLLNQIIKCFNFPATLKAGSDYYHMKEVYI